MLGQGGMECARSRLWRANDQRVRPTFPSAHSGIVWQWITRLGLFHQPPLWREQVLGPRRRIGEGQRRLLDRLIRRGQAPFVLAHMFLPGRNAENLDDAVRPVSVPEKLPARRSSS